MPSNPHWHRPEIAARFQDAGIVEAYDYREPYPPGVFEILRDLIVETPRVVLDIGCGRGELARPLLAMAERVDAVDWSQAMIAKGKTLSGGDDPRLRWIYGRVEEVALEPPYALITAGGSLHWMDWDVVLPHLSEILTPQGCLALPNRRSQRPVWAAQAQHLIERFSTNPDFREVDMLSILQERGLFDKQGERATEPMTFRQPIDFFVEALHSRSILSRATMTAEAAEEFDTALRRILAAQYADGIVEMQVLGSVVWGKPRRPK